MIAVLSEGISVYVYRRASDDIEILQLRRASGDIYPQTWQPIYGGVHAGEKAVDAARRELLEETGIISKRMFLVEYVETVFFRPNNAIHMFPVFAAEFTSEQEIRLNEEHDAFRWVSSAEVKDKFVFRTQREAISVLVDTLENFAQNINSLLI